MTRPTVSVVIPTKNRRPLLIEALDSVLALSCDQFVLDVIVVDDGSVDDTTEHISEYALRRPVRLIASGGIGMAGARNVGIGAAHGEYVSLLDDDDLYLPTAIASQLDMLEEHPSYGAAFANWRSNPNTGEIRGSSVYFSSLWLWEADGSFSDDPGLAPSIKGTRPAAGAAITAPPKAQTTPMIGWQPMAEKPLCMMWAPQYSRGGEDAAELAQAKAAVVANVAGLTKKPPASLLVSGQYRAGLSID